MWKPLAVEELDRQTDRQIDPFQNNPSDNLDIMAY